MNTDLKKYLIVLNKIKFGMGDWVILIHLRQINLDWRWVNKILKNCVYLRAIPSGFYIFICHFAF
jgi:hypothetical protein